MNSLRQLTRSSGKQCKLRDWAKDRQILITSKLPLYLRKIMNAYAPPKLWGFADLHAHPAAHLAFGADAEGNSRLFWGKPGLRFEDAAATMPSDLAPCVPDKHCDCLDPKPVLRKQVHDAVTAWGHCPPGCDQDNLANMIGDAVEKLPLDPGTIWNATFAAVMTVEHIAFAPFLAAAETAADLAIAAGTAAAPFVPMDPTGTAAAAVAAGTTAAAALASADPLLELMDLGLAASVATAVTAVANDPNIDPVKLVTRMQIVDGAEKYNQNDKQSYEGYVYFHHDYGGWPDFGSWPNASSLLHQQMHISWIRRAWQGGLRLMIASTVDNQLFSNLWNRSLMMAQTWPEVNPDFDFNSAVTQLTFIRDLVEANSSWMEIVETPAEARQTVADNKLAVILGVEMDSLTAEQIVTLKNQYGVRQVVPIHLANNSFGGVAANDDVFNTNNWYLQGGKSFWFEKNSHCDLFLKVCKDELVDFKLDPSNTQYLEAYPPLGVILPTNLNINDWPSLLYDVPDGYGHINQLGLAGFTLDPLDSPDFLKLMKAGLLIDLAHMSSKSQDNAIQIAGRYHYPLMNSHGGIRPDDTDTLQPKTSERSMRRGNAGKLSGEGGVIGLGVAGYRDKPKDPSGKITIVVPNDQIERWIQSYWEAWNALNFRGVAIGTDANGFSPMIPSSSKSFTYPFIVDTPQGAQEIFKSTAGGKTFDFEGDGIAHYGMLADFMQALRQFENGADIADYLLVRTVEDTIEMWEAVEQASSKL
jgi:microsomal dipeptidase-like Zn-dependent dipeptidase